MIKHFFPTPNFERIWWDKGGDTRQPISIWQSILSPGYAIPGDCVTEGFELPTIFPVTYPVVGAYGKMKIRF